MAAPQTNQTDVEPQTMVANALLNKFRKVWRCHVLRSGYHNGATCTPDDPHGPGWNCQYVYEAILTIKQYANFERRIATEVEATT